MNSSLKNLSRHYAAALRCYLADQQESVLHMAYQFGRNAIAGGFGVLDIARMHQQTLAKLVAGTASRAGDREVLKAAETFLLESLSPFEVTHRGFQETNPKLQQLIKTLEKRNAELAEINGNLAVEVEERKRTEAALRESEDHFRELFRQASTMEENLRKLSNQILHAQEEERKHISRELHDEVGQALTAISVTLATLRTSNGGSVHAMTQKLADAQRLLQKTMETVHRFARELRPTMLDELGLLPALRSYLKGFAERTGLRVSLRGNAFAENLGGEQKTVLFRVAQESLTNVSKHAEASRVAVTLRKVAENIWMEVADNGRSFRQGPENSIKGKTRLGLLGMQERVRLVNGRFMVKAEPGRGTTIRVVIPFAPSKAAALSERVRDHGNGRRPRAPLRSQNLVRKR
jgi:signal transduction histidine kinase